LNSCLSPPTTPGKISNDSSAGDETVTKSGGIPLNFVDFEMPAGAYKMIMEWRGKSNVKSDWSGWFTNAGYAPNSGRILSVEPLGFEKGEDSINYEMVEKEADSEWESYSNKGEIMAWRESIPSVYPGGGP